MGTTSEKKSESKPVALPWSGKMLNIWRNKRKKNRIVIGGVGRWTFGYFWIKNESNIYLLVRIMQRFPFYRLAQCVRLCMAIAIFLSYGLQFYVPMNIIWPKIEQKFSSERAKIQGEYAIRVLLVLFTCKWWMILFEFWSYSWYSCKWRINLSHFSHVSCSNSKFRRRDLVGRLGKQFNVGIDLSANYRVGNILGLRYNSCYDIEKLVHRLVWFPRICGRNVR